VERELPGRERVAGQAGQAQAVVVVVAVPKALA